MNKYITTDPPGAENLPTIVFNAEHHQMEVRPTKDSNGVLQTATAAAVFWDVVGDLSDCIVDETYIEDPSSFNYDAWKALMHLEPKNYPFQQRQCVLREDGRLSQSLGLDWFETGIARPAVVQRDLVRAFSSNNVSSRTNQSFWFLRNLARGEQPVQITPEHCELVHGTMPLCSAATAAAPGEMEETTLPFLTQDSLPICDQWKTLDMLGFTSESEGRRDPRTPFLRSSVLDGSFDDATRLGYCEYVSVSHEQLAYVLNRKVRFLCIVSTMRPFWDIASMFRNPFRDPTNDWNCLMY